MKIGRNDPCICGSGKKYKKCCLFKQFPIITPLGSGSTIPSDVVDKMKAKMLKEQQEQENLKKIGIYVNYVKPIIFKGKKVWALGSTVYYNRPSSETFHEFIIDMLRLTLGKEWWDSQTSIPFEKKHFIMQCFQKFREWWETRTIQKYKIGEQLWAAYPDGWSRSLVSIAFDVVSLIHSQKLPEHLLTRLKNMNEFQGARYELAIAAIFARLGCQIKFLDDEKIEVKHAEFIATHLASNSRFTVEVKSKHRKGVLNFPGEEEETDEQLKGKVFRLLHDALRKEREDIPYLIFVDVNSPLTPGTPAFNKKWVRDIMEQRKIEIKDEEGKLVPYNAIYFTNFSYHYQKENITTSGEFISEIPLKPQFPFPNNQIINMLHTALNNYGNVPNLDTETTL